MNRSWFVYIIRFRSGSATSLRDRVRSSLREKGIATHKFTSRLSICSLFIRNVSLEPSRPFLYTEQAAEECLALPFHTRLSEMEIKFVCDAVNQALNHRKQQQATASTDSVPFVPTQAAET